MITTIISKCRNLAASSSPQPVVPASLPQPPLQFLGASSEELLLTAGVCLTISLLILLVTRLLWSRRTSERSASKPLVTVEVASHAKDRVAVLMRRCRTGSALARHCRRLLLERGFAEVREVFLPSELDDACQHVGSAISLPDLLGLALQALGYATHPN